MPFGPASRCSDGAHTLQQLAASVPVWTTDSVAPGSDATEGAFLMTIWEFQVVAAT